MSTIVIQELAVLAIERRSTSSQVWATEGFMDAHTLNSRHQSTGARTLTCGFSCIGTTDHQISYRPIPEDGTPSAPNGLVARKLCLSQRDLRAVGHGVQEVVIAQRSAHSSAGSC